MDSDHLDIATQALDRGSDAADQATPADRHHDPFHVGQVRDHLEARTSVARDHLWVGEGMKEELGLAPPCLRRQPIQHLIAWPQHRLAAPALDAIDLGGRGGVEHDHPARHPEAVRRVGASLRRVAGADSDQAMPYSFRHRNLCLRRRGEEAADLEAPGRL